MECDRRQPSNRGGASGERGERRAGGKSWVSHFFSQLAQYRRPFYTGTRKNGANFPEKTSKTADTETPPIVAKKGT